MAQDKETRDRVRELVKQVLATVPTEEETAASETKQAENFPQRVVVNSLKDEVKEACRMMFAGMSIAVALVVTFPLLLSIATVPPAAAPAPAQPARPSLFDVVEQHMSAQGRPIFQRYVAQTLVPQAQADVIAQRQYLQSLHALVYFGQLNVV